MTRKRERYAGYTAAQNMKAAIGDGLLVLPGLLMTLIAL